MIGSVMALSMMRGQPIDVRAEEPVRFLERDAGRLRVAREAGERVRGGAADALIDDRRPSSRRRA